MSPTGTPTRGTVVLDAGNTYQVYATASANPAGLTWSHIRPDGQWCAVNIPFRGYGRGMPEWTVVLEDPLTVTPALRCPTCRARLWLDGGKGRPA